VLVISNVTRRLRHQLETTPGVYQLQVNGYADLRVGCTRGFGYAVLRGNHHVGYIYCILLEFFCIAEFSRRRSVNQLRKHFSFD